ncbi:MAG: glycosyltransferase, partial [Candidatus Omnitrophica bacterium]|nr:glycosyltransferase [Candidatus Omnitrophota bacterium]
MKNKIKVIHLVDDLKIGGLERMLATIVTHLDKNRYEVMVGCLIGGGDIAEELIRKNIQVKILSFSKSPFLVLWRLIFWLRKEKPKIIHCWALSAGVLGRLAGFFVFVPVIILHVQNVYYGLSEKQRIIERILSFITHKIIACSEGVKESLVNFVKINK